MNVSEDPRNTGPRISDGIAGHSPVNKNVNQFKEFQSHVDQWFITSETLVELFGFFLPEKCTMPVKCNMLLLGVSALQAGTTEKSYVGGAGISVDGGKAWSGAARWQRGALSKGVTVHSPVGQQGALGRDSFWSAGTLTPGAPCKQQGRIVTHGGPGAGLLGFKSWHCRFPAV